jgi:ribosomal protein S1
MSYGAFVKLEPGIEGFVHICEMSLGEAGRATAASW